MKSVLTHCLLTLLLLVSLAASAQPPRKFYTRFGGSGYDQGYDVKQTLDNGYIIAGSTSSFGQGNTDAYLVKLDSVGQIKWQKAFGNYNNEIARSVVQLSDSSYVLAGYTNSSGFGGYDFYVVKTDKNGNELWNKTYGGTDWDFAYSLQKTADGGFIIVGTTYSYGRGQADGYVIKTDGSGNVQWTKTYGGAVDDEFKAVIQLTDGNYALAGYTKSYNDPNGDAWIFKLDVVGDSLYSESKGGAYYDYFNGVTQLHNGYLFYAGANKSQSNGANFRTWDYCFDPLSYAVQFDYVDVGNQDEYYADVVQGRNGTIAACGTTHNASTGLDGLVDMLTGGYTYLNFFSHGSINNDDELFAIDSTWDKGFIAVGSTRGFNAQLEDVFLLKIDSVGTVAGNIVGVEEQVLSAGIQLYPNPVVDVVSVSHNGAAPVEMKLYDIAGNLLREISIEKQTRIDLSAFSAGVYLSTFSYRGRVFKTEKLILTH